MLETVCRDLVSTSRGIVRARSFSAAVVFTLALGIGGTAAMFTAINVAFLKPLPYPQADRLVLLWQTSRQSRHIPVSMADSLDWAARSRSFVSLCTFGTSTLNVTSGSA